MIADMTVLVALDRATAASDGGWAPSQRVAVDVPAVGGMPAQPIIAPLSSIGRAQSVWAEWAADLEENPMASVDNLKFPHVTGNEDMGKVSYGDLSRVERQIIDVEHASGVN